jgi:hypothetical protein
MIISSVHAPESVRVGFSAWWSGHPLLTLHVLFLIMNRDPFHQLCQPVRGVPGGGFSIGIALDLILETAMLHRRRLLLLLCAALVTAASPAQQRTAQDTLEQEILAHPETDLVLLGKTRAVLLESLKAADTEKARKVMQFMESKFNGKRMVLLYQEEELLVNYWLGNYSKVLSFARSVDADEKRQERIAPQLDQFYDDLVDLSRHHEGSLRMNIRRGSLAPHERDFVLLLFSDIIGRQWGSDAEQMAFQTKMNDEADSYLASYANSEYNIFVRKYIRFVYARSEWGYGYGLSLGYIGVPSTMSRHLGDYFDLSFNGEAAYKQVYAHVSFDIGFPRDVKKEFEYKGTWPKGLSVTHVSLLLAAGPLLTLGNGFMAIPTVGISFMDFSPPENEEDKTEDKLSLSFAAWSLSANFHIPLDGEDGGSFITVNAGLRRAMTGIELARGGYTFITIGFGIFGRPVLRDL